MKSRFSAAVGSTLVVASTLVLLAAFTTVGCGGGGGSSPSPTSPTPTPAPGPSPTPTPDPAAADVTITIVGMNGSLSYSPNPATVTVGQTVAWRNADSLPHTATADGGAWGTLTLGAGSTSAPITMTTAGTYPYHCVLHGTLMTGTLVVVAPDTGNGGY